MDDPRIYFAVERTLLAWIRTSITIIVLGFVIARFGLFMDMVVGMHDGNKHIMSIIVGVALIVMGMIINTASLFQFVSYKKTLSKKQIPRAYNATLAIFTSSSMIVISGILIWYLVK